MSQLDITNESQERSVLSQQVTTRHQQTDVHESITKQDRNNINDPQKKHRLGTVSQNILLEGFSIKRNLSYLTEVQWDISDLPFARNKDYQ